jgi:hypothetical protein
MPTGKFKILINAITKGNTIVVDTVIDPTIVSKNTGRVGIISFIQ